MLLFGHTVLIKEKNSFSHPVGRRHRRNRRAELLIKASPNHDKNKIFIHRVQCVTAASDFTLVWLAFLIRSREFILDVRK